ncbi:MAG: hypothetical protein EA398_13605 [Deltaproteobacteria bacterium]|nr:MAG: hypothetical protein EA398_13605 [Deltaproteobacteria bacterium]
MGECRRTCRGHSDGQRLATAACFVAAADVDGDFRPSQEGCSLLPECFPPPEEPAPGSAAYCRAVEDACDTLGAFSDDFADANVAECAWVFTGADIQWGFVPFEDGARCAASLSTCDPEALYGCLAPPHPPCDAMCAALVECGLPSIVPDWDEPSCRRLCYLGYLDDPDTTTDTIECVETTSCFQLSRCF